MAASLVDAFNIPDFILNAPLGRKDGDIYQKYLETVQNSRNGIKVVPFLEWVGETSSWKSTSI